MLTQINNEKMQEFLLQSNLGLIDIEHKIAPRLASMYNEIILLEHGKIARHMLIPKSGNYNIKNFVRFYNSRDHI